MSAEFSPKVNFQTFQADSAEKLKSALVERWFNLTLEYALADCAHRNLSDEGLYGIRIFIETIFNLPEKQTQAEKLPIKRLNFLGENPTKEQIEQMLKESKK